MERAARPGWHGIPPSRDRFIPPESRPEPTEGVYWTTEKAPPIWAELTYPGDIVQRVKGFAMAWTNHHDDQRGELVLVQWVEYSMARTAWVTADKVRRRQLESQGGHRSE